MSIAWTNDLATGVADIDNQHREIFARVNRLSEACAEGKGKEEVLKLLNFLEDYVREHFAAEEKLQIREGYPEYAAHKAMHARFIADLERLASTFREEGATLSLVIMTNKTLTAWLVQHISKVDMELAAYLKGAA
ncbi:bacteriohemerythrin [Geomonas silvestris]|nr:bacteriohemerythrin [Geomonas silvestris]